MGVRVGVANCMVMWAVDRFTDTYDLLKFVGGVWALGCVANFFLGR